MSADEESGLAPMATLARYHAEQKAFHAEQQRFNARVLEMLSAHQLADAKLEARLDAGARTFDVLREKIVELKPTPIPWTQKMALAVAILGLVSGAAIVVIRAPSREDFEQLRTQITQMQLEQVRMNAAVEAMKVRQP